MVRGEVLYFGLLLVELVMDGIWSFVVGEFKCQTLLLLWGFVVVGIFSLMIVTSLLVCVYLCLLGIEGDPCSSFLGVIH